MPARVTAGLVLLGLAAASCSSTVEVAPPAAGDEATCERLVGALPERIDGAERREVSPAGAGAAWGDPPVVLSCGTGMPEEFDEFSRCEEVAGVGWFVPEEAFEAGGTITITTIGWDPVVSVEIPVEHQPPAAAMVDVAPAITEHAELVEPCQ